MESKLTVEEVVAKASELEQRMNDLAAKEEEQRVAREKKEERNNSFYSNTNKGLFNMEYRENQLSTAMIEKRAVTLSGTGVTEVVPELIKLVGTKGVATQKARFFRGPKVGYTVPLVASKPAKPTKQLEGATGVGVDTAAALTTKGLAPETYMSILPITWEMAKYSVVSEGEVVQLLAESFGDAIEEGILSDDASGDVKGIFASASVDSANKTACKAAGLPTLADMYAFAGKVKQKNGNFEIYIPVEVMTAIMTEKTDDYNFVKEELSRSGSIRGIKVIESGNIAAKTTAGASLAVAIDLGANYGVVLTDDIEIKPLETFNSANVYFRAIAGLGGDVIQPKNAFALVAA